MRISTVTTKHDPSGEYEIEVFDHLNPTQIIVCSHGNGVRRWDGEKFFYKVAEHYANSIVMLVDQNQPISGGGVVVNPLPILIERVSNLIDVAKQQYPNTPIVLMGHSMGCGVATYLDVTAIDMLIFVAPAVGLPAERLIDRYGEDITGGKTVLASDGLTKIITTDYYNSIRGVSWETQYIELIKEHIPVYVFEAGDDEIVGDGRFAHRDLPFTGYEIIKAAKHNFSGMPLKELFKKIDFIIQSKLLKS